MTGIKQHESELNQNQLLLLLWGGFFFTFSTKIMLYISEEKRNMLISQTVPPIMRYGILNLEYSQVPTLWTQGLWKKGLKFALLMKGDWGRQEKNVILATYWLNVWKTTHYMIDERLLFEESQSQYFTPQTFKFRLILLYYLTYVSDFILF